MVNTDPKYRPEIVGFFNSSNLPTVQPNCKIWKWLLQLSGPESFVTLLLRICHPFAGLMVCYLGQTFQSSSWQGIWSYTNELYQNKQSSWFSYESPKQTIICFDIRIIINWFMNDSTSKNPEILFFQIKYNWWYLIFLSTGTIAHFLVEKVVPQPELDF